MPRLKQKHKDALVKQGDWADFVVYRDELKTSGASAAEAQKAALVKFLGEEVVKPAPTDRGRRSMKMPKSLLSPKHPEQAPKLAGDKEGVNENKDMIYGVPGHLMPVRKDAFDGKPDVSEIVNITWVCDNMQTVDVSVADCPSLRAWNLLSECRRSEGFRMAFWKDHYSKTVPAKSSLKDDDHGSDIDGTPTLKLIEKIQKASTRAKKTTQEEDA
jgi:hypothetical protein